MAKSSEVSLTISSHNNSNMHMDENDNSSMNPEIIAFDKCLSKLEGDNKKFFGALMTQLAEAHDLLDQKGEIEREDANELAALKTALEEEQQTIASLEDESARLLKERDCAKTKLKVLKKEKTKLDEAHDKIVKDLDDLVKDYKNLESENSTLINENEQLQARLNKYDVASSSSSTICDHANIIEEIAMLKEENSLYVETNVQLEALVTKYGLDYFPTSSTCENATILEENVRLNKELAKLTTSKNKMSLDDLLSKQRSNNKKHGLGYAPHAKKKEVPAQAKKRKVHNGGKAQKGKDINLDHSGLDNPHYELFTDYYGDVYA